MEWFKNKTPCNFISGNRIESPPCWSKLTKSQESEIASIAFVCVRILYDVHLKCGHCFRIWFFINFTFLFLLRVRLVILGKEWILFHPQTSFMNDTTKAVWQLILVLRLVPVYTYKVLSEIIRNLLSYSSHKNKINWKKDRDLLKRILTNGGDLQFYEK